MESHKKQNTVYQGVESLEGPKNEQAVKGNIISDKCCSNCVEQVLHGDERLKVGQRRLCKRGSPLFLKKFILIVDELWSLFIMSK